MDMVQKYTELENQAAEALAEGNFDRMNELVKQCEAMVDVFEDGALMQIGLHHMRAIAAEAQDDLAGAEPHYNAMLAGIKQAAGVTAADICAVSKVVADYMERTENPERALELLRDAAEGLEKQEAFNEQYAEVLEQLAGLAYDVEEDGAEAEALLDRALQVAIDCGSGPMVHRVGATAAALACETENHDWAMLHLGSAFAYLDSMEDYLGQATHVLSMLGSIELGRGNLAEALALASRAEVGFMKVIEQAGEEEAHDHGHHHHHHDHGDGCGCGHEHHHDHDDEQPHFSAEAATIMLAMNRAQMANIYAVLYQAGNEANHLTLAEAKLEDARTALVDVDPEHPGRESVEELIAAAAEAIAGE